LKDGVRLELTNAGHLVMKSAAGAIVWEQDLTE
jgi:hypothetical protein